MDNLSLVETQDKHTLKEAYYSGSRRVSQNNQGQYIIDRWYWRDGEKVTNPYSYIVINTSLKHIFVLFPINAS